MLNPINYPEIFHLIVGATTSRDTFKSLRLVSRAVRSLVDRVLVQDGIIPPELVNRPSRSQLLQKGGRLDGALAVAPPPSLGESIVL